MKNSSYTEGPTITVDTDWNATYSHGCDATYFVQGNAVELMLSHIRYLEALILNCGSSAVIKDISSVISLPKEEMSYKERFDKIKSLLHEKGLLTQ